MRAWIHKNYFPSGWIEDAKVDYKERLLELPSCLAARKQRILWLGYMIAKVSSVRHRGAQSVLTGVIGK